MKQYSTEAANMLLNTAAIGRAIGNLLHPQGANPGRVTTSGRGAPNAKALREKRKAKNKAARKARKR